MTNSKGQKSQRVWRREESQVITLSLDLLLPHRLEKEEIPIILLERLSELYTCLCHGSIHSQTSNERALKRCKSCIMQRMHIRASGALPLTNTEDVISAEPNTFSPRQTNLPSSDLVAFRILRFPSGRTVILKITKKVFILKQHKQNYLRGRQHLQSHLFSPRDGYISSDTFF